MSYPKMTIPPEVLEPLSNTIYRPMKDMPSLFFTSSDLMTIMYRGPNYDEIPFVLEFLRSGYIGGSSIASSFFSLYHHNTNGKDCHAVESLDTRVRSELIVVVSDASVTLFSDRVHETIAEFLKDKKCYNQDNFHAMLDILYYLVGYVNNVLNNIPTKPYTYTAELHHDETIAFVRGRTYE